jgi:hypothetical protein
MPDPNDKIIALLTKLSEMLHESWEKENPITEAEMATFHQIAARAWEKRQALAQTVAPSKPSTPKPKTKAQEGKLKKHRRGIPQSSKSKSKSKSTSKSTSKITPKITPSSTSKDKSKGMDMGY